MNIFCIDGLLLCEKRFFQNGLKELQCRVFCTFLLAKTTQKRKIFFLAKIDFLSDLGM